jgi:hypothetical protein
MKNFSAAIIAFSMASPFVFSSDLSIDRSTGAVIIGEVTSDQASQIIGSKMQGLIWYERGSYQPIDFGYIVEDISHGIFRDGRFEKIEDPIYLITEVDIDRIIRHIDPDGEFANGCEYTGFIDGDHVIKNVSNWCDPEFTLKKLNSFDKVEQLVLPESKLVDSKLINYSDNGSEITYIDAEPGLAGLGTYTGYINKSSFSFDSIYWLTSPEIKNVQGVTENNLLDSESDKVVFEYNFKYSSYDHFPKIKKSTRLRKVNFEIEILQFGNKTMVQIIPDYWDGSLPMCSDEGIPENTRCNFGYKGEVSNLFFNKAGLPSSIEFQ